MSPEARDGSALPAGAPLMEISDLKVHFGMGGNALARLTGRGAGSVKAVDGVDLTLHKGEVVGLVGESGSGKTTLGRALLGLNRPTGGTLHYRGINLAELSERKLRPLRRELQMVFQDPHASLNPAMDVRTAVGHPLRIHGLVDGEEELTAKVVDALERVGMVPATQFLDKFPGDLSGGQKQRVVLARAIIAGPELLVADEPISMLDMSVRAKILELMLGLRRDLDLTFVYVTHDLASAKFFCDRIAIMYLGRVVELGTAEEVFEDPKHPYTKALLAAIPEPDPRRSVARDLPRGEVPDASRPPAGCAFHPRCPVAVGNCGWEARDLRAQLERRWLSVSAEQWATERAKFAHLGDSQTPGQTTLEFAPAGGATAEELLTLLQQMREEDSARKPREPFWTGVTTMDVVDGKVRLRFVEAADPALRAVRTGSGAEPSLRAQVPADTGEEVTVACHLYDVVSSGGQ